MISLERKKGLQLTHLPIIEKKHLMLPGKETHQTVCIYCKEIWPCSVTELILTIEEAEDFIGQSLLVSEKEK